MTKGPHLRIIYKGRWGTGRQLMWLRLLSLPGVKAIATAATSLPTSPPTTSAPQHLPLVAPYPYLPIPYNFCSPAYPDVSHHLPLLCVGRLHPCCSLSH